MSDMYEKMGDAVFEGDDELVIKLVNEALEAGDDPKAILDKGLISGMDRVAIEFRDGDMFVPEVLMSAQAMQGGNELLKPLLVNDVSDKKGTVIIGTVKGDLHDIGKKIVGMMLEGAGFEVIDLGMDVPSEDFIKAIQDNNADLVGMSAMLTTTMPVMQEVVEMLKEEGLDSTKPMIGGAPVSDIYADKINANYSYDAASAVELANNLIK